MKILNLIKCEFIKNYTLKTLLFIGISLVLSVIAIVEINEIFYRKGSIDVESSISYYEEIYENYRKKEKLNYQEQFELFSATKNIEILKRLDKIKNISQRSWQYELFYEKLGLELDIFVIDQIKEHRNDSYFSNIANSNLTYYELYEGTVNSVYSDQLEVLEERGKKRETTIKEYDSLLEKNEYYRYLEYKVANHEVPPDDEPYYQMIIDKKVTSQNDYRAMNLYQYDNMYFYREDAIVGRKEWSQDRELTMMYPTYEGYVRYHQKLVDLCKIRKEILKHAIENDQKHDLSLDKYSGIDIGENYITTKIAVNQVGKLSIVVIILVTLTSGGILSKEHASGTEKILLTSPVKRWKVLVSKFLYLILHSYIIFLAGLLLFILYAGIKYGFSDLFTPKLIFENGSVLEVNYLLYTLKDIVIRSIPIISFLSLLLLLSTITLSTSFTVGMMIILAIVSPFSWYIISTLHLPFLAYTPFCYFDISAILEGSEYYLNTLKLVDVNLNLAISISIITTIVFYLVTNWIYIKRDIKN